MKRHGRKKRHTQGNSSTFNDKNKAPDMHNNNDWILKEILRQYYNEETRKHKKKSKNEKLTLWEGLILLLLLIENGILDEFFKNDEFEEFDEDEYEGFNIKSKHKNKGKESDSKKNYTNEIKEHAEKVFSKEKSKKDEEEYQAENKEKYEEKYQNDNDGNEPLDEKNGNKNSHFDFDYFAED